MPALSLSLPVQGKKAIWWGGEEIHSAPGMGRMQKNPGMGEHREWGTLSCRREKMGGYTVSQVWERSWVCVEHEGKEKEPSHCSGVTGSNLSPNASYVRAMHVTNLDPSLKLILKVNTDTVQFRTFPWNSLCSKQKPLLRSSSSPVVWGAFVCLVCRSSGQECWFVCFLPFYLLHCTMYT